MKAKTQSRRQVFFKSPSVRLGRLINKGKWEELRTFLQTPTGREAVLNIAPYPETVNNVMHQICMWRPPLDIVRGIADIDPKTLSGRNGAGQTALHVAANYNAGVAVIEHLIEKNCEAASMVDNKGRTPLMLACGAEVDNHGGSARFEWFLSSADIVPTVQALCEAAPTCVDARDHHGKTAVDYALGNGASKDVVHLLNRHCKWLQESRKQYERIQLESARELKRVPSTTPSEEEPTAGHSRPSIPEDTIESKSKRMEYDMNRPTLQRMESEEEIDDEGSSFRFIPPSQLDGTTEMEPRRGWLQKIQGNRVLVA